MIRTFIAFKIPPAVRDILIGVQKDLKDLHVDMRYTRPQGMHLTLKFLGNIREEDVDPIHEALRGVCVEQSAVEVYVDGIGMFPNSRNPRVVWAGLEGDLVPLYTLQQDIEQALIPLGYEPEARKFQAHLTLGRVKRDRKAPNLTGVLDKLSGVSSEPFKLEELILYKSTLRPGGAEYEALRSVRIRPC